jgi:hypothetical protein
VTQPESVVNIRSSLVNQRAPMPGAQNASTDVARATEIGRSDLLNPRGCAWSRWGRAPRTHEPGATRPHRFKELGQAVAAHAGGSAEVPHRSAEVLRDGAITRAEASRMIREPLREICEPARGTREIVHEMGTTQRRGPSQHGPLLCTLPSRPESIARHRRRCPSGSSPFYPHSQLWIGDVPNLKHVPELIPT